MDSERLGIADGELVEVSSSVGSLQCEARIDETIPKGRVGMHFHFEQLLVKKLFPTQFDENTFTPNYKMTSVAIRRLPFA